MKQSPEVLPVRPAMRRSAETRVLPPESGEPWHDPVYRNLTACCNADAVRAALQRAARGRGASEIGPVRLLQRHYKPFARARMVFAVQMPDSTARLLYLCLYAEPARAIAKHEAALAAAGTDSRRWPPILLSGWNGVGWWLPDAPNLAALDAFFDRTAYRRFLTAQGLPDADRPLPALVRYVPRQRALFRSALAAPAGGLYIKCYRPPGDVRAAANLARMTQAWKRGRLAFRPPCLIFHDVDRHAVGMDEVAGQRLTDFMGRTAPDPMQQVGIALAGLHGSGINALAHWTPAAEIAALKAAMADVSLALPVLGREVDALIDDIERRADGLAFDSAAPVHGNLFGDQILVDDGHIGIVDWDDLALGDPLHDVGRLIAHMRHEHAAARAAPEVGCASIAGLLRGYARASGHGIDASRLRWQVAVALLMRAKISALRALPEGWIAQIVRALDEARAVLADRSPWLAGSE